MQFANGYGLIPATQSVPKSFVGSYWNKRIVSTQKTNPPPRTEV
jgi:hypothetical protein